MNLTGECNDGRCCEVKEAVVHRLQDGAVSPAWLSACREERALTAGIMEEIASLWNLQKAYVCVKQNGGSGGADGMDMKGFRQWARSNMGQLQSQLIEGVYEASPVRGVQIPKPQGGYRQLGIPTLRDRLASSPRQAERIMQKVILFIEERLKLKVNREKSRVCKGYELTFLGHSLLKDGTLGLGKGSEQRFKVKLEAISSRRRGVSILRETKELGDVTRGWLVYYRKARMQKKIEQIDGWLRRRLRCLMML